MSVKVSVVVPVHNARRTIENAVGSILAQTMPADDLELICVDDGSTDDSLARLRELEARHPVLRVISIPASGWPGKPRNVGTDAASGEYVMYLDADDRLQPESLQRMYSLGAANDADIVLGKVTSDFRFVHHYLYRRNIPRCGVGDSRIINSLTPHKMFRRTFLAEHGLRYPEGYHRLEDQLFVTRAYLAATTCSVVSDYVCYRYLSQENGANIGRRFVDPNDYYRRVRTILDAVDEMTEPGPLRDHVYRRFLRVELLGKMIGRRILYRPREARELWLSHIRELLEERFSPAVESGLQTTMRLRAHLARTASSDELRALTERTRKVQPSVTVELLPPSRPGVATLRVSGELALGDETLRLSRGTEGWLLPDAVTGPEASSELRLVEPAEDMMADLVLREPTTRDEWFLAPPLDVAIEATPSGGRVRFGGDVTIDPLTSAAGGPLPKGTYELLVRTETFGLNRQREVRQQTPNLTTVVSAEPRTVLSVDRRGRTRISVSAKVAGLRKRLGPIGATTSKRELSVRLAAGWTATPTLAAELHSGRGRRTKIVLTPQADTRTWTASIGPECRPGRYRLRVRFARAGWMPSDGLITVPPSIPFYLQHVGRTMRSAASWAYRRLVRS